jgi:hypothetical protein
MVNERAGIRKPSQNRSFAGKRRIADFDPKRKRLRVLDLLNRLSELVEMVAVMILRLRIENCNGRRDHETAGVRLHRLPFDRKVGLIREYSDFALIVRHMLVA